MREVGEGRGGPEDLEKTRTPQSTPKPNLQSAVWQGERETLPPDRIRRKKEIFWPEGSLEGGLRPSEGTVGGDVLGPPWVLQAIFDVAAPVSQDNDEAGTIYLVCSPPRLSILSGLPSPCSFSWPQPVGAILVLLGVDQTHTTPRNFQVLNLEPC